jgi:hypothetical protein
MTDPKPPVFLRLKWHFRENWVLYLGLIFCGMCLIIFDPNRRPSGARRRWLWDIDPDLYVFVTYGLFLAIAVLCFAIIARTAYRTFKGTDDGRGDEEDFNWVCTSVFDAGPEG